jgi:hypothetical protein
MLAWGAPACCPQHVGTMRDLSQHAGGRLRGTGVDRFQTTYVRYKCQPEAQATTTGWELHTSQRYADQLALQVRRLSTAPPANGYQLACPTLHLVQHWLQHPHAPGCTGRGLG